MKWTSTVDELISLSKTARPDPIVEGLLRDKEILLIHAPEESFKSVFVVQMGIAIATGSRFLDAWDVPQPRKVGVLQTEMHAGGVGERLERSLPGGFGGSSNLLFLTNDGMQQFKRAATMQQKIETVKTWLAMEGIEVLMIDPANDFFREADSPSEETAVGVFFDQLRLLDVKATVLIRHDRKPSEKDLLNLNTNNLIRGSAEWKEDPESIIHLRRKDPRHTQVELEVGKLRYGVKPESMNLWFDAGRFELTPLPPIIKILVDAGLPVALPQLEEACEKRFGLAKRSASRVRSVYERYLSEGFSGHNKTFELNLAKVLEDRDKDEDEKLKWLKFVPGLPTVSGVSR